MGLTAENVSFSYPGRERAVLEGVSFSLERGERLGLMAPSGSGKTTLCRILAGYERPAAGRILLDGRPLEEIRGPACRCRWYGSTRNRRSTRAGG